MHSSKVRYHRERAGFTQTDLADKAGLSIRTIQRIESQQTQPKGYTLKALAQALAVNPADLVDGKAASNPEKEDYSLHLMNLSCLLVLVIPFGNIIGPMVLWLKYRKTSNVDEWGRRIINFQIVWTVITSMLLGASPFIQKELTLTFPLILLVLLTCICFNVGVIIKTAVAIRNNSDFLNMKLRLI